MWLFFLRNHVILHTNQSFVTQLPNVDMWRDPYKNNFPCVEFIKVYDNHKIICVTLFVLIFCSKSSIQNCFVQRT